MLIKRNYNNSNNESQKLEIMEPKTVNTEKKKMNWPLIAGIGILALLLVWFFCFNLNREEVKAESTAVNQDESPCIPSTEAVIGLNITGEEYIAMKENIARLEAELAACRGEETTVTKKVVTPRKSSSKAKSSTPAAPAKNASNSSSTGKSTSSQTTDVNIATNQYVGEVIGDAGCTFDENGFLFYYVANSLINSIENRNQNWSNLNSQSGPEGEVVGEYTYYRTPILILTNMLDQEWGWTSYLGDNTTYGYDMWLFHELVKLNPNLINDPQIQDNGLGGYKWVSKVNYKPKKK